MRKKTNFLIYSLLIIGVFVVFVSSCKKDDDDNIPITSAEDGGASSFTDPRDGNVYQTITIGSQVWMAENLKYLPSVFGSRTGAQTSPYYYVYGYEGVSVKAAKATPNYTTYGVLYNWKAAINACPAGWHLPSDAEWTELTDYLGGEWLAGDKLKGTDTKHWKSSNNLATNETGFTALPGGNRGGEGRFYHLGYGGGWWSATETNTENVWYRSMGYGYSSVIRIDSNRDLGLSVRCLKD